MASHLIQRAPTRVLSSAIVLPAVLLLAAPALAQEGRPANRPAGAAQDAPAGQGDGAGRGNRGRGGPGGMFRGMGRMGIQSQIRESFEPDFVRRDVPLFKEQLGLEDSQMSIVEQLMNDYEDAFGPARDEMSDQMQAIGRQMMAPMMTPDMQEKWRGAMDEARAQMEQMAQEKGAELTPEERQQFFRAQMEKLGEDVQKEMRANGSFDQMRASLGDMVKDFERWQQTKAGLRKALVDGLKASLSDPQQQRWPAFERFLVREKTLPRGTLSGESVNLFLVLDEAGLSKESIAALQTSMDDYELQLDSALRARNDFLAQNEVKLLEFVQAGDADGARKLSERILGLRERVREVNDRFRDTICSQLGEADAGRVRQAALAASYERVYGQDRVGKAFEAALAIEGLDPSVKESIAGLLTQYGLEAAPLNDRIANAIRKEEPARQTEDMVRVVGFMSGDVPLSQMFRPRGNEQDESAGLFEKRADMNDRYLERLQALLSAEQWESIPKGREAGRGGQGGFAAFGGGGPIKLADLPQQAQDRMKQFDKNGDGTIDDTERQAMMEEFRRNGGPGGVMGGGGGGGGDGGGNGGGRRGNRGNAQSPN
jgi:hypothetical protein